MNKTAIKNFAVWARKKLISEITYKAGLLGITEKCIADALPQSTKDLQFFNIGTKDYTQISKNEINQRNALVSHINEKAKSSDYKTAFQSLVEEVAYTWFNRLIAVRFMEVNDYLPSRIRVLSSESSAKSEPDFVTTPFDTDLEFSAYERDRVMQLKDENKLDELFRMLFIKQCNKLNEILPELFEKTDDYTELLLNISFTDKEGVLYHLAHDIDELDFKEAVEIIGWMYQYYNTEPKDETFALLKNNVKITKERIPSATQLFTPDWIVRYMVENSLGRLWLEGHSNDTLKADWKYYLDEAEQEPDVKVNLDKIRLEIKNINPEGIKVIDPCMGSGHILVYAFEVLIQIYESCGYTAKDAASHIIEKNIYGLDIDDRAYQLSYFAIMMKGRKYDRRFLTKGITPNLCAIQESNAVNREIIGFISQGDEQIKKDILYIFDIFRDAKEYGSIINVKSVDFKSLDAIISKIKETFYDNLFDNLYRDEVFSKFKSLVLQAKLMSQKYDIVTTNPPYMGKKSLNSKLSTYMDEHYSAGKSELYSAFILRCMDMTRKQGFTSMITIHTWMFISSFENLRKEILSSTFISSMMHTGAATFEELNSFNVLATAFILRKISLNSYISKFIRLTAYLSTEEKIVQYSDVKNIFILKQKYFNIIPGNPFVYWVSNAARNVFNISKSIKYYSEPKQGLATADNERFVRNWFEVAYDCCCFNATDSNDSIKSKAKWFPYNKGGNFRKWYGMNEYVLNWYNGGFELKNYKSAVLRNPTYYFKSGITWSLFGFENFGVRYKDNGFIFDVSGSSMFPNEDKKYYILAFLASKVAFMYLSILAPTVNFQVGNIGDLPLIVDNVIKEEVDNYAKENIELSREDWNDFEESWDFAKHPLLKYSSNKSLICVFDSWSEYSNKRYAKLKANEERINRLFIDIYGLQNDVTPEVVDRDIALRQADLGRDTRSFISYAVGCMLGRYNLDIDGLAYAGGDWNKNNYITYIPDSDNCIPITDEEYFEDDIVGRFVDFIKIVYGTETFEENLDFIAKAIGNRENTAREVIRHYFIKDFYKDHCKIYQKRPIYWMFDSGKEDGFKALIYMHRYNADTIGNMRIEYLHRMQKAYENAIVHMQEIMDNSSNTREVVTAEKRKGKLIKQLKETKDYDQKVAHLALSRLEIDLDDGVVVNYERVQTGTDGKKLDVLGKI